MAYERHRVRSQLLPRRFSSVSTQRRQYKEEGTTCDVTVHQGYIVNICITMIGTPQQDATSGHSFGCILSLYIRIHLGEAVAARLASVGLF